MICIKCGKNIPDNSKFCGYCGSKQDLKKTCPNCHQLVDSDFAFCNFCGEPITNKTNDNGVFEVKNQQNYNPDGDSNKMFLVNKDQLKTTISSSLIIMLSLIMSFILFDTISYVNLRGQINFNLNANIVDYISSFIKGLGTYSTDDFTQSVAMNLSKVNHTVFIIFSDYDNEMLFSRVAFYLSFFLIISLFIIPLINASLCAFKLYKKQEYKKSNVFSISTLLIILTLFLLMPLNGFKFGSGLIIYLIINVLLVVYHYIENMIFETKIVFLIKTKISSLIYSLLILILFMLIFQPVSNTYALDFFSDDISTKESNSYGLFYQLITFYDDDSNPSTEMYIYDQQLGDRLVSQDIKAKEPWLMYYSLVIPITTLLIGFLLLRILFFELISFSKGKYKKTGVLLFAVILVSIVRAILIIIFEKYLTDYFDTSGLSSTISFKASAFNIIFIFLVIGVFVYQIYYKRLIKNNNSISMK